MQQIKRIAVDPAMITLVLAASGGKVYLYHLPTALTNERLIAWNKLKMGVDRSQLSQSLTRVDPSHLRLDDKTIQTFDDPFITTIDNSQLFQGLSTL